MLFVFKLRVYVNFNKVLFKVIKVVVDVILNEV